MTEQVSRSRPRIVVFVTLGLLAFIAAQVVTGLRFALRTPETGWSEMIAVFGLGGLPFVAPLVLRRCDPQRPAGVAKGIARTIAFTYLLAFLLGLSLAPHPVRSFGVAAGLAALAAIAGAPALAPAALYVCRKEAPDPLVVSALVAVCVLMPIPTLGGIVLAGLLAWRRSLVDRLP